MSKPFADVSFDSMSALIDCALNTDWGEIPSEAKQAASVFLLDSLAVGVSGYSTDSAAAVRATVHQWGADETASVLGGHERLPPGSAAYVNAFQVHCQEFDCLHEPATVHAMAVLTGALLAMAEREEFSGRKMLLGTIVGVEVAVSLGLCATRGLRFFRPATAGAMGACAALARLVGFDRTQFLNAMGLTYSQLAGTMQAHVEGSVALPLQVAAAARAAINSIELVEQGLTGPHDVLDGPFGYFEMFEANADPAPVLSRLGDPWRVTELSHKPFPTGRAAHATLDAVQRLTDQHSIARADIKAVNAHVPPLIARLVARPYKAGMSVNYARLCLQYLVPVLLKNGQLDTSCFSRAWLSDPEVANFAPMVNCVIDDNQDPNALSPQRIEIVTQQGQILEKQIPNTLGSPKNPLDDAARLRKLTACFESAGLEKHNAQAIQDRFSELENCTDFCALLPVFRR